MGGGHSVTLLSTFAECQATGERCARIPRTPVVMSLVVCSPLTVCCYGWLSVCPSLGNSLFSLGLLPIIIFESGYSLNLPAFFSQLGTVLIFALAGTVTATVGAHVQTHATQRIGGI